MGNLPADEWERRNAEMETVKVTSDPGGDPRKWAIILRPDGTAGGHHVERLLGISGGEDAAMNIHVDRVSYGPPPSPPPLRQVKDGVIDGVRAGLPPLVWRAIVAVIAVGAALAFVAGMR